MSAYPYELGLTLPAEWENHRAVWLAWPWDQSLWKEDLLPAQREFVSLVRAIQKAPAGSLKPTEWVYIVCPSPMHRRQAERALEMPIDGVVGSQDRVRYFEAHYGDIWFRDTAPIFVTNRPAAGAATEYAAVHFQFNGWGGKYKLQGDDTVGQQIARFSGVRVFHAPWILEGGSIDSDGQGLCLTTKQCLLNTNRNPGMTQGDLDQALRLWLGQEKVLWLADGLQNDHTDGHIDNLARFVAPGTVVCSKAESGSDPNAKVMEEIEKNLRSFTDRSGKPLEVITLPSPGAVTDEQGAIRPASYMNFYISNTSVVVPNYGSEFDAVAIERLKTVFPDREIIGLRADHILSGGGSFHCISQQFPGELDPMPVKEEKESKKTTSEEDAEGEEGAES